MLLHDAGVDTAAESAVLKQINRFGGATPERIAAKPKLGLGLQFFLTAFYDLDTERDLSTMQPIAWSSIVNYAKFYNADISELLYFIRKMDNAYLTKLAAKRKAELRK